jgi:hypothetical protein
MANWFATSNESPEGAEIHQLSCTSAVFATT